ncbi:MAG: class I SAM-dependent methyltransferase [Chloroflexi bacterium]|nr:class I SAM-dependent methyltransferase [Chloroflexota bacterium]MBP7043258.1 class I SAM-dependent methyltransferase [Chloroflexota bacterium]
MRVTAAAERAVRAGHPWLFADSITRQNQDGRSGDLAILFDQKNRFLAVGLFDPDSPLRVRILHHGRSATIDAAWWEQHLRQAAALRQPLLDSSTTGYRLVYGENDGFPGLVIDRYAETYVLKLYTTAWLSHLADVLAGLTAVAHPLRVVLRLNRAISPSLTEIGLGDGTILAGPPLTGPVVFRENGLNFAADVIEGQKTGFFLDQRDNRARVEGLANGSDVLNVFAYSGGFSLYAARGGARRVASLDLSRPALQAAAENFALNGADTAVAAATHDLIAGDAFAEMARLAENGRQFDLVIIDPPAFAKKQAEAARALGAYARLARLGLAVLRPGGTLVMASCSSRVSAEEFFALLHQTAREEGRPLREIARTGHALDHPIRFPEAAYLKCLFAIAA